METQFQLTILQQRCNGSGSNPSSAQKRAQQEGEETSQQPSSKKHKANHPPQQSQSFRPKQLGAQSSSGQHNANSSFMRPVPGQGLICFKCGKSHRASECNFSLTCHVCGRDGHMGLVCKKNPDLIIKWQRSVTSAGSGSTASSRGSAHSVNAPRGTVQMMAGPLAPYY